MREMTDGVVTLRRPVDGDAAVIVAGRDEVFRRFMGAGSDHPDPTFCVVVDGELAGWVDYDFGDERPWLTEGRVNVGYHLFAAHRNNGYATRAVHLLVHHLAIEGQHHTATVLIDPDNAASLAVAERAGFVIGPSIKGQIFATRPVPPIRYSDGDVSIRPPDTDDLQMDLSAKDEEQIRWLWLPGQRETWMAKTIEEQQAHALRGLVANRDGFGTGPKWNFTVDAADHRSVGYVDCDLANVHSPAGEANISYAAHPDHRGRGYTARAVRLIVEFLGDHTGTNRAHIVTNAENAASRRVATAVRAVEERRWVDEQGNTMISHRLDVPRNDLPIGKSAEQGSTAGAVE